MDIATIIIALLIGVLFFLIAKWFFKMIHVAVDEAILQVLAIIIVILIVAGKLVLPL